MSKGLALVISGPSGSGKDTLISYLMEELEGLCYSVSATTRPPRNGEVDGKDYFFVSREEFEERIKRGTFLEWAQIYGDYYGTPQEYVAKKREMGYDVILKIDVQGARQIRSAASEAIFVFIAPPSMEELRRRIQARGTETAEAVEKRFQTAVREVQEAVSYDYIVVNDRIPEAVSQLKAVIQAEKSRVQHMWPALEELFRESQGS